MCRSERIPEIGKLIGPGVIAHRARTIGDLKPLLDAMGSERTETRTVGEEIFRHLIGTLFARHPSTLAAPDAGPWPELLRTVTNS